MNIISVSGGKDSVALWLWAKREGLEHIAVYQDTGWEWEGHYAHLDLLERLIGPLIRITDGHTFESLTRKYGQFPSRVRRWCTRRLKIEPFKHWLDGYRDKNEGECTVLLGIRREEGGKRATALEREWSEVYDCEVWRPILDWTVEDVIREHTTAGVPMHPLYHHGSERVGCFPCINATKSEIRCTAELDPGRIDLIRELERETGYTMFVKAQGPVGIDEVVAWSKTKRGGKELELVRHPSGCARWGICEPQPEEAK